MSFTEQTLLIELGIIMITWLIFMWARRIIRKMDEEERREDDG